MLVMVKGCKKLISNEKVNRSVFDIFKEDNYVNWKAMINELAKRTHLPKWICRKVYDAEASILSDLGLIKERREK